MTDHKKCDHMNPDGTFKEVDGSRFNGCVLHMMECEGHDNPTAVPRTHADLLARE